MRSMQRVARAHHLGSLRGKVAVRSLPASGACAVAVINCERVFGSQSPRRTPPFGDGMTVGVGSNVSGCAHLRERGVTQPESLLVAGGG